LVALTWFGNAGPCISVQERWQTSRTKFLSGLVLAAIGGVSKLRVAARHRTFPQWARQYSVKTDAGVEIQRSFRERIRLPTWCCLIRDTLVFDWCRGTHSAGAVLACNAAHRISGCDHFRQRQLHRPGAVANLWQRHPDHPAGNGRVTPPEASRTPARAIAWRTNFRLSEAGPPILTAIPPAWQGPGECHRHHRSFRQAENRPF